MEWFLYDNGLRHERVNADFSVVILVNFCHAFQVSQLWKIVQTWKSKLILVSYFCNILTWQGWGLRFPFPLHQYFIRLLWICFPIEKKTFSKYSYLPLLVIITITTIYIINKRFSQKLFYQAVTWRCQFQNLLVKNVYSGMSMAYYGYTDFWDAKIPEAAGVWYPGTKLPRKCFIFMFRKSLKQAKSSLK